MLTVSVIVPVYNAARHLTRCLEQLSHSLVQPLECILVDDGSTDSSMAIARRFPVQLLSTGGRLGPAYARNLGARHAQGAILLFLDSDVCVHPDTVERVRREFERSTDLDALIGSYDELPDAPNFISQYKNLQHCFVHQHGREGACTFWAGCGGIRRDVFLEFGGFDEGFARPSIEDIELGYRLRHAGRKLALNRDIQVKHLKRWTLWNLLKTDIFYRGVPWTELTLSSGWMPDDLNLRWPQRICVALVWLVPVWLPLKMIYPGGVSWAAFSGLVAVVIGINLKFYRFLASRKGLVFTMRAIPVHCLYYFYSGLAFLIGLERYAVNRLVPHRRDRTYGSPKVQADE